jgi:hypothetical protein
MFNSYLFDFTEGWFYVFGVGPPAQARMCPASSRDAL